MKKRMIAVLSTVFVISGCAELRHQQQKDITSGMAGCPASEVELLGETMNWTSGTWTAKCRGKTFHCVEVAYGGYRCQEEGK